MAQNITLFGASYTDVPAVLLPKTGGGDALFYDVQGSQTITQNGTYDVSSLAEAVVNVAGSGGIGTLLQTTALGTFSSVSTSATDTGKTVSVSGINSYDFLIVEISVDTIPTQSRHLATITPISIAGTTNIGTKDTSYILRCLNIKKTSSAVTSISSSTAYGIYGQSVTISNGVITMKIYTRQNSTQTGTINGDYTARVYGVNLYDLIGG